MTGLLDPLPPEGAAVIVLPMLKPSRAVDLFLGDLTRRSRSESGRIQRLREREAELLSVIAEVRAERDALAAIKEARR